MTDNVNATSDEVVLDMNNRGEKGGGDAVPVSTVEFKKGKDTMKIRRTGTCTSDDGNETEDGNDDNNSNNDHHSLHLSPGRSSVSPLDHPECNAGSPPHPLLQHIRHSSSSRSVENTDTKNNRREDPPADMTPMETTLYFTANEEQNTKKVDEEERELREMISALEAESAALALAAEKAIVKAKRVLLDVYTTSPSSFSPLPGQDETLSNKARGVMETLEAAEREAVTTTGDSDNVKDREQSEPSNAQRPRRIVRPQRQGGWENEPSHVQTTRVGKQNLNEVNPAVVGESMEEGTLAASDEGREPKEMNSSVASQKDRDEENVGQSVSLSKKKLQEPDAANDNRVSDKPKLNIANNEDLTKLQSRLDVLAMESTKSRSDFETKTKEVFVDPIRPVAKPVTSEETSEPIASATSPAPSSIASAPSEKVPAINKKDDIDPICPADGTLTNETAATTVEPAPKSTTTTSVSVKVPELKSTLCDKIEECQAKLSDPNTSISELMDAAKLIEKLARVVVAMEPIER